MHLTATTTMTNGKQHRGGGTSAANSKDTVKRDDPPNGRTYLAIGQDLFSIEQYVREQYNRSLHEGGVLESTGESSLLGRRHPAWGGGDPPRPVPSVDSFLPAAAMVYTDIQTLRGLTSPADYGSGVEYADGLLGTDGNGGGGGGAGSIIDGLQVGLWLNGTSGCRDVVDGKLDRNIRRLFDYLLVHAKAKKVYLRVGYEFDNPDFGYSDDPAVYRLAFRKMVDTYHKKRRFWFYRNKIEFVWHSWAASVTDKSALGSFYPGDNYVDMVGISVFSQLYPKSQLGSVDTVDLVLDFAKSHGKPVMIAESTVYGGIDSMDDPWNDWFQPVLALIERNDVAMWSYINCDWTEQPMWKYAGFGDTRLSSNATVMDLWNERVLDDPRFLMRIGSENNARVSTQSRLFSFPVVADISSSSSSVVSTTASGKLVASPWLWIPVSVVVVVAGFCLRYFCRRDPDRVGYVPLEDEIGDEYQEVIIEPNRTGYGALADEDFSEGL